MAHEGGACTVAHTEDIENTAQQNKEQASAMSVLDQRPLRVWGHPLTIKQQIWIGYILPASFACAVFLLGFSTDIGVVHQLFRDSHPVLAAVSLLLVYAPAVLCLILTLLHLPQVDHTTELMLWIIIQVLHCIFFPIGVIHRFATCIFWSVCALMDVDPEREQALQHATKPHHMELFLLFNAFLHAAPQALLQAYVLLSPNIKTRHDTDLTQAASVIISVTSVALAVASYQRYESQKAVGRMVPWAVGTNNMQPLLRVDKFDPLFLMGLDSSKKSAQTRDNLLPSIEVTSGPTTEESMTNADASENPQQEEENVSENDKGQKEIKITPHAREQATGPTPQNTSNKLAVPQSDATEEPTEQDGLLETTNHESTYQGNEEQSINCQSNIETLPGYLKPTSSVRPSAVPIDRDARYFWPHIDTPPSTPTADPHMRPRLSFSTARNPTNPPLTSHIALPVREPRTKGLAEDEPLGVIVAFFGWWCFLISRVLSIAAFTFFYPWASLGLILCHYAIMIGYLFFCHPCPNFFAPLMGLIFILCPVEVKIRFKYPRLFLISFIVVILIENIATLVLWYYGAKWSSWWYRYTCYSITGSLALAALNAALYVFLFKPKPKYVF